MSASSDPRQALGVSGERAAERHLRGLGWRVLARRYRTPVGELDLVMRERDTVVFVEVKTLGDQARIEPHEHHSPAQQRRAAAAARLFLHRKQWLDRPCRFDLVGVSGTEQPRVVQHIRDAWTPRNL